MLMDPTKGEAHHTIHVVKTSTSWQRLKRRWRKLLMLNKVADCEGQRHMR